MMNGMFCPNCARFEEKHRNIDGDGVEQIEGVCRKDPPRPHFPTVQKKDYCETGFVPKE